MRNLLLQTYAKSHPFAQLSGSDNVIAFSSRRYSPQPLIIRFSELTCNMTMNAFLMCASPVKGRVRPNRGASGTRCCANVESHAMSVTCVGPDMHEGDVRHPARCGCKVGARVGVLALVLR